MKAHAERDVVGECKDSGPAPPLGAESLESPSVAHQPRDASEKAHAEKHDEQEQEP